MTDKLFYDLSPNNKAEKAADYIISKLQTAGHSAFRVGGAVRDRLIGRTSKDVDVATSAKPQQVKKLFTPHTYAVGESFGVIIVHTKFAIDIEVATFRSDDCYIDGRRPKSITFATIEQDAQRRDLTINALYYNPTTKTIHDFTNGITDLKQGIIKAIGNPKQRYLEDHLRLLRTIRFAAELNFAIEPKTKQAIPQLAQTIKKISPERIFAEITKMLTGKNPHIAFQLLHSLKLLPICLPEINKLIGVEQPPQYHPEGDVWQHTLIMLSKLQKPSPTLAWAVLLHDVGKPETAKYFDGRFHFNSHDKVGQKMSKKILRNFKCSKQLQDNISNIVGTHMKFMAVKEMRQSTLRRFINRPTFADDLELHRLDCISSHGAVDNYIFLIDKIIQYQNEPIIPPPLLTGKILIKMGIKPGPQIGKILRQCQELQLNEQLKTEQEAISWLKKIAIKTIQ